MRGKVHQLVTLLLLAVLFGGCAASLDQSSPGDNRLSVTGPVEVPAATTQAVALNGSATVLGGADLGDTSPESLPFVRSGPVAVPPFPLVLNQTVQRYVDGYLNQPESLKASFARSSPYMAEMLTVLHSRGLPSDLVYLTFAESCFTDTGSGPWQLSRATARRFGLMINPWVDERRDPIKSTKAAAAYLATLHDQEDSDWRMTLVAWNNGENGVSRYRHLRDASYDLLVRRLPHRTRELLNRFMAVAMIARHSREFGIEEASYQQTPSYRVVAVKGGTHLSALANFLHTSVAMLQYLNPGLLREAVPPGRSYAVRVPSSGSDLALRADPL